MRYIFYIPGLGGRYDSWRSTALKFWRWHGITAELLPTDWEGRESYEKKYQRVRRRVAATISEGGVVSLVGESAGSSIALRLYAELPAVHSVVTIAGANNTSSSISPFVLRRARAFSASRQAAHNCVATLSDDRCRRVHTVNGIFDRVVSVKDSAIAGSRARRIPVIGHFATIAACLTLLSGLIVHYATSRG